MIKKLLVVAVVGAVAVVGLRSTKWGSYVRQEAAEVGEWAEAQVPAEKEIKRLKNEVKSLEQDVTKVASLLATENVDVRKLREKVGEQQASVNNEKALLVSRGEAIKNATEKVSYGNRVISVAEATKQLASDAGLYKTHQRQLEAMELQLAAREKNRETLEKQLSAIQNQRQEMAAAVDRLEAELNVLKVQQTESKYQTDDSRLAGIKQSIAAMDRKISIEREKLRLAPTVNEGAAATTDPAVTGKSVDEILNGLDAPKPAKTGSTD